jgi:probable HAF family extracellular repeat protein
MRVLATFACIVCCAATNATSASEYSFMPLGAVNGDYISSIAAAVSADGSVIVGTRRSVNGSEAFRWTAAEGMAGLGDLPGGIFDSVAHGVSADGSVITGWSTSANGQEAFRWTAAEGMRGLGDLAGGDFKSHALEVSADGSVIVGSGTSTNNASIAFRWTEAEGMRRIADAPIARSAPGEAWGVSADGSVVVGEGNAPHEWAFRWTAAGGSESLGDMGFARAVSADGSVVVGAGPGIRHGGSGISAQAYRWTRADGAIGLGDLPGDPYYSDAYGVSADGSVVVGRAWLDAAYWTEDLGLLSLPDYLLSQGVANLSGWRVEVAAAVSADGRTVVGYGKNASGAQQAWAAVVAEPSKWRQDSDGVWSDAANWPRDVPNRAGATAVFSHVNTAPRTVTTDRPITVGYLGLNSANSYAIAGDNTITLDDQEGHVHLNVGRGTHTISAPITLADNAVVNVLYPESRLAIRAGVNGAGMNMTKAGAGTLTVNQINAAGLTIDSGTVVLSPNEPSEVSVFGTLALSGSPFAPTARLDLNGAAVIDYSGRSPANLIGQLLLMGRGGPGRDNGDWTGTSGITSSAAAAVNVRGHSRAIGFADNSTMPLGPLSTFRGRALDETSILMAYTRAGDANLDGLVNDDDVTIVGAMYNLGFGPRSWATGDFNYDFRVDDEDVTILGVFYDPAAEPLLIPESLIGPPAEPGANGVAALPEPGSVALLVTGLVGILVALRVRRKSR